MTQLLPSTAQEMAGKAGVPYNEGLLRDTGPTGAAYQQQLGGQYLQQALNATGNPADALRYYHGGPNRKMWGPAGEQYVSAITQHLGGL